MCLRLHKTKVSLIRLSSSALEGITDVNIPMQLQQLLTDQSYWSQLAALSRFIIGGVKVALCVALIGRMIQVLKRFKSAIKRSIKEEFLREGIKVDAILNAKKQTYIDPS
jgi:hypothetical protein